MCLDRDPEQFEVDAWHYFFVHGDHTGVSASHTFLNSEEFLSHGYDDQQYVEHLYAAMMGREPSADELAFWVWVLTTDHPDYSKTRDQVFETFADSDEFKLICYEYGVVHS